MLWFIEKSAKTSHVKTEIWFVKVHSEQRKQTLYRLLFSPWGQCYQPQFFHWSWQKLGYFSMLTFLIACFFERNITLGYKKLVLEIPRFIVLHWIVKGTCRQFGFTQVFFLILNEVEFPLTISGVGCKTKYPKN